MRRILTISLIFIGLSTSAQNEWGKHGAEWFYETGFVTYTGYVHCKVEKDTLIGGKTAQIIACREYTVTWGSRDTFQRLDQYTYTDSNKVYYYRFGNWYTLYDFSADTGDAWTVAAFDPYSGPCDSTGIVTVDSIDQLIMGIDTLKTIHTTRDTGRGTHWYLFTIHERIGSMAYMFPVQNCKMITDLNLDGPLRCYYDSLIGWYNPSGKGCTYLPSSIEEKIIHQVKIYPSPAAHVLNIELPPSTTGPFTIEVYSISGQKLIDLISDHTDNKVNISSLTEGLYLLILTNRDGEHLTERFIKSR